MKRTIILSLVMMLLIGSALAAPAAPAKVAPKKPSPASLKVVPPPPPPPPAPAQTAAKKYGWTLSAGLDGGAGSLIFNYNTRLARSDNKFSLGYGLGKNFNLIIAQLGAYFELRGIPFCLSLDVANYSEKVRGVPGISGDIAKGSLVGLGLTASRNLGRFTAELGYSFALGLTANAVYEF
jgi:hypothetical protein